MVSIIVPIYKVEKYLPRCIDSILAQTYRDLEIILVDDGSPDGCGHICDDYAKMDSRVRVIHQENSGLGCARNTGLDIASGEYLMFVDSDDYISDDAVQVLLERVLREGSDMAVGKHTDLYEDGTVNGRFCSWMKDSLLMPAEVFASLSEETYLPIAAWGKIYKRTLFDKLRYNSLKCAEDLWLYPSIVEKCKKISVVNKTVYFYFQRDTSILHQKTEQTRRDDIHAILNLVSFLKERGFEQGACRWYGVAIDRLLHLKNKSGFLRYFNPKYHEYQGLLRAQNIKTKLKWVCLHLPFLYDSFKFMKRLLRREI